MKQISIYVVYALVLIAKPFVKAGYDSVAHKPFNPWDQTNEDMDHIFGIEYNPDFKGKMAGEKFTIAKDLHFLETLARLSKFQRPPFSIEAELSQDNIVDYWEANKTMSQVQKSNDTVQKNLDGKLNYAPVIGILTQPTADTKMDNFNYKDYILEVNDRFIKWAGSRTVAIPYNIPEDQLMEVLSQINGVLFTGGGLDLIDPVTKHQHVYYKTAKKIFNYSKMMKDVNNEQWPILGICQGLEVISILMADDDINVLDTIIIYGQNRNVTWKVNDVQKESRMFKSFPKNLTDEMHSENLMLHAHTFSVSLQTYNKYPKFVEQMKVTSTDTLVQNGTSIEFITTMEGKDYPLFASMYHPEYQMLEFIGPQKWSIIGNKTTDEIAFRFSLLVNRFARQNNNRVRSDLPNNILRGDQNMSLDRYPSAPYPIISNIYSTAFGYNDHPIIKPMPKTKPSSLFDLNFFRKALTGVNLLRE